MTDEVESHREPYRQLLELPDRPRLLRAAAPLLRRLDLVLSSGFFVLITTIIAFASGIGWRMIGWLLAGVFGVYLVLGLSAYVASWIVYVKRLEDRAKFIRVKILEYAGLDDAPGQLGKMISIKSLTRVRGSVRLVFNVNAASGIKVGSRFAAIETATGAAWGIVRVTEVVDGVGFAEVVDRGRPEFWEKLEDRMGYNPVPPEGFHLEPDRPDALRYSVNP